MAHKQLPDIFDEMDFAMNDYFTFHPLAKTAEKSNWWWSKIFWDPQVPNLDKENHPARKDLVLKVKIQLPQYFFVNKINQANELQNWQLQKCRLFHLEEQNNCQIFYKLLTWHSACCIWRAFWTHFRLCASTCTFVELGWERFKHGNTTDTQPVAVAYSLFINAVDSIDQIQ